MRKIVVEPFTQEAFAPFGEVLSPPTVAGKAFFEKALGNLRPEAWPCLYLSRADKAATLPLQAVQMERHEFSSQSFVPMGEVRFLVVAAPHHPEGGPDMAGVRVFLAEGGQGVTYAANTWHHPLTVLDAPASFGVFMWRDGTSGDEEFVDIEPFEIAAA